MHIDISSIFHAHRAVFLDELASLLPEQSSLTLITLSISRVPRPEGQNLRRHVENGVETRNCSIRSHPFSRLVNDLICLNLLP